MKSSNPICAKLRQDFGFFLRYAFRVIGGQGEYVHGWHIDAIAYQLSRVLDGDIQRLMVTMPPRHLKSITVSVAWVAWMLGNNPALRFITASYGQDLAEKHARDCLKIMDSDWYQAAFPSLVLSRRTVADFETSAGGGRLSTSVDGPITGRGADIIITDDPMKSIESTSEAVREHQKRWLRGSVLNRLENPATGAIIMVAQRLHEDDLIGELKREGGWFELCLPAIATHDEEIPVSRTLSYKRREGHPLHPARQSLRTLRAVQARDPIEFAAQHQQDPIPREGNYANPEWFGEFDMPPTGGIVCMSCDTASKTGISNDHSVAIVSIYHQRRHYIIDVYRGRLMIGDLLRKIAYLCERYKVERLLIEDAASGMQVIQLLREKLPNHVPWPIACKPEGDKKTRFSAQASRIQHGEVLLPRVAGWKGEFLKEITGFPNGRYDDQADALAQLLANPPPGNEQTPLAGPVLYVDGHFQSGEDLGLDSFNPWKPAMHGDGTDLGGWE